MPTYEYVCPKCGHEFEQFQPMSDAPLKRCPKCKKLGLKRLVGAGAGLIFKGTGFYITDYKNKPSAPAGEGGESKPSAGEIKAPGGEAKSGGGESKAGEGTKAPAEAKPAPAAKPAAPPKATKSAKKR
jgi:putative FmdB family regulatory protein